MGWFDERLRERPVFQPNVVFVVFYGPEAAPHFKGVHSVSDRRSHRGFVFAPLTVEGRDHALINVGHELLHLFGATDKYDAATNLPTFPDGYADPEQQPLLPQKFAEIMAGRIALSRTEAEMPHGLDAALVGTRTAHEINWVR